MKYKIQFDDDFDTYAWELEAKGWVDLKIDLGSLVVSASFYDPARLLQEISNGIATNGVFFEKYIIVVPKITRDNVERAVEYLNLSGAFEQKGREQE